MAMEHLVDGEQATNWALMDDLRHHLGQPSFDVPASVLAEIATRLEEVIAGASRADIALVSFDLASVIKEAIRHAPQDSIDAALGEGEPGNPLKAAHLLGQLGFAQLLAAQAASRRVEDDFVELLSGGTWRPYANALYETELRNIDLAAALGFDEATVSRELRKLREKGVTDFRRRGREVFNFLTPAAHQAIALLNGRDEQHAVRNTMHARQRREPVFDLRQSAAVKKAMDDTESFLRQHTTLAIAVEPELTL